MLFGGGTRPPVSPLASLCLLCRLCLINHLVEALVEQPVVHQPVRPVELRVVPHQGEEPVERDRAERGQGGEHLHAKVLVHVVEGEEERDPGQRRAEDQLVEAFLYCGVFLSKRGE